MKHASRTGGARARFWTAPLWTVLSLGALLAGTASAALAAQPILLEHATIIDGTGRAPLADGALLIRDGRIAAVGAAGTVAAPGAKQVDLTGRTILPGLISDHSHTGLVKGTRNDSASYTRENIRPSETTVSTP